MTYSRYKRFLATAVINGLRREAVRELRHEEKVNKNLAQIEQRAETLLASPTTVNQILPQIWRVGDKRKEFLVNLNDIGGCGSCNCWLFKDAGTCQHLKAVKQVSSDAAYFAHWAKGYWQVWNLSNRKQEHYTVTKDECDCGDWVFKRSKDGTKCKHQNWFYPPIELPKKRESKPGIEAAEAFPSWPETLSRETSVDESKLPRGVWVEKTDEWVFNEYLVWCYEISRGQEKKTCIGRLYDSLTGIQACLPKGLSYSTFPTTRQAAIFLVRRYGLKLEQIEAAMDLAGF